MDVVDVGSDLAEANTEAAIKAARLKGQSEALVFKGECYNCEAKLDSKNFCDVVCRDEYEELNRRLKNGRKQ